MKRTLSCLILALALPLGLPTLADMSHMSQGSGTSHAAMANAMSEGTVRKVDRAQGKVTIRHGELVNLDMPPMTMVFRVQDPAMLDQLKPGDTIQFRADRMNGMLTVTQIGSVK